MQGALDDITVLDLGQVIAMPFCTMRCAICAPYEYGPRHRNVGCADGAPTIPVLKLSETPARIETLAPAPGEHNEAVFMGLLGHTKDELERWRADGVM
ncbi:MAG TPA: hypothetical protein VED01_15215 [Burkholderiales bacterium]|nr:hypothetical protein [Burkholderiales bacterium]